MPSDFLCSVFKMFRRKAFGYVAICFIKKTKTKNNLANRKTWYSEYSKCATKTISGDAVSVVFIPPPPCHTTVTHKHMLSQQLLFQFLLTCENKVGGESGQRRGGT